MFDIWEKEDPGSSRNVWLPVWFNRETIITERHVEWDLSFFGLSNEKNRSSNSTPVWFDNRLR